MTEDLEAARRRLSEADDELERRRLRYLAMLAEARRDHEDAKAEREKARQNLLNVAAREKAAAR